VKTTRTFDVACFDTPAILTCLYYIFTTAAEISPNVTPEKKIEDNSVKTTTASTDSKDLADHPIALPDDDNDDAHTS